VADEHYYGEEDRGQDKGRDKGGGRPYDEYRTPHRQPDDGGGGGGGNSAVVGWVIFILIFGVGNLILYATTGIFIIPIPRR
jgi:hypothetical protein